MKTSLKDYSRIEVKASLKQGDTIWFGAADGLYRYRIGSPQAVAVPQWDGREIRAIGPASGDGFYIVSGGEHDQAVFRCNADGKLVETIPAPAGAKGKSISGRKALWFGAKNGVYKYDGKAWQHVFDGNGKAEIINLWERGDTLRASVKKIAPHDRAALATTTDGGKTWSVETMPDYQDIYLAADDDIIITRWRGARRRDATKTGYKKHPLSAGWIDNGATAVLDGEKLEMMFPPRVKLALHHPMMAEAEHLYPTETGAVFAGSQGAYAIAAATGTVRDLMPVKKTDKAFGKTKKVYALDDGALLAATTFGVFRSTDNADSWQLTDSEWVVFDAEAIQRAEDGRWWLACQRGIFNSGDNGKSWYYQKLKSHAHHYCEFRDLAVGGGYLALATKAGLFIGKAAAMGNVEIAPVEAIDDRVVEAVAFDPATGKFSAVEGSGALWRFDPATGSADKVADLPSKGESKMIVTGKDQFILCSEGAVLAVSGASFADLKPAASHGKFGITATGSHLLLWDKAGAWLRKGSDWAPVSNWPAGMRSVAVSPDGKTAVATDRTWIHRVSL